MLPDGHHCFTRLTEGFVHAKAQYARAFQLQSSISDICTLATIKPHFRKILRVFWEDREMPQDMLRFWHGLSASSSSRSDGRGLSSSSSSSRSDGLDNRNYSMVDGAVIHSRASVTRHHHSRSRCGSCGSPTGSDFCAPCEEVNYILINFGISHILSSLYVEIFVPYNESIQFYM